MLEFDDIYDMNLDGLDDNNQYMIIMYDTFEEEYYPKYFKTKEIYETFKTIPRNDGQVVFQNYELIEDIEEFRKQYENQSYKKINKKHEKTSSNKRLPFDDEYIF